LSAESEITRVGADGVVKAHRELVKSWMKSLNP
jgi:hypothetical protein